MNAGRNLADFFRLFAETTRRSLNTHVQTDLSFWKIYLDTCCLSRLFDPPTQERIVQEAETIRQILAYFFGQRWHWIASDALLGEINRISDLEERSQIRAWLMLAHQTIRVGTTELSRGMQLEMLGFQELDALHIARAESGEADLFLTTDDRLLRRAQRHYTQLDVRVENPFIWLQEVN